MAVATKGPKDSPRFYVKVKWQGRQIWIPAGTVKRDAERLNARTLRAIRAGTFLPPEESRVARVGQWLTQWADLRRTRTAVDERRWLKLHVLPRAWFAELLLDDVRPRHLAQLVEELKTAPRAPKEPPLSGKSIANIFGILRTAFRDARIAELIHEDPCVLPKGSIQRKGRRTREPYTLEEVGKILGCPDLTPDKRVFAALLFFTGCREGEVCGLRWRALDRRTAPLWCLTVKSQYADQPLKTDKDDGDTHPRAVPVHPALAKLLAWWWSEGFELVFCERPTEDGWIVPQRIGRRDYSRGTGTNHNKCTGYKLWRAICRTAGVPNRSLHSTRHTMITMARRGGATPEVLEKVTHNARGTILDGYTHWTWDPLCHAVMALTAGVEPGVDAPALPPSGPEDLASDWWRRRESNPGTIRDSSVIPEDSGRKAPPAGDPNPLGSEGAEAEPTARPPLGDEPPPAPHIRAAYLDEGCDCHPCQARRLTLEAELDRGRT